MVVFAVLTLSGFVFMAVLQPRMTLRRQSPGIGAGWSETTCLLSYVSPRFSRGPDSRLRFSRARRNLMLASYGWAEPTAKSRTP